MTHALRHRDGTARSGPDRARLATVVSCARRAGREVDAGDYNGRDGVAAVVLESDCSSISTREVSGQ